MQRCGMQRRGGSSGRALPALVALVALLVALASGAWWWLGRSGPQLAPLDSRPRADHDATAPLPSPVRAEAQAKRVGEDASRVPTEEEIEREIAEQRELTKGRSVPTPPLHGRVVARHGGEPIAGAELVVPERVVREPANAKRGATPSDGELEPSTPLHLLVPAATPLAISAADGHFTLPAQPADPVLLFVRAPGFGLAWCKTADLAKDGAAPTPIELDVECRLEGSVRGAGDLPIAGATLVVELLALQHYPFERRQLAMASSTSADPPFALLARTDRDGRVTARGLPAFSDLDFQLLPPKSLPDVEPLREPTAVRLSPGETIERRWQLGGGVTARGRLLDEAGAPLGDVLIWLSTQGAQLDRSATGSAFFTTGDEAHVVARAFTDELGRFEWSALAAGDYWIGPAAWSRIGLGHAGGDLVPLAVPLELVAGSVSIDVELRAQRGLFVTGRTVDRRGAPVTGSLQVRSQAGAIAGEVMSYADVEGNFRAGPLAAGDYELRFLPSEARYAAAPPLLARAGSSDLQIDVADAAVLVMEARVDGRGEPVAASFLLVQQGGDGLAWIGGRGATPSSDDRFDGLPAATFTLGATTADGFAGFVEAVTLAEGETRTIEVALQRGALVVVSYRAGPVTVAQVALQSGAVVVAAGELPLGATRTFAAPAGRVRLRVGLGAGTVVRDLELVAGSREEVVIDER
ncbi:MAG: hypothetical protein JNL90_15910 [Planctomycetes bacterium]|nr:hypothetical protein [Planctomycetota bacterium]